MQMHRDLPEQFGRYRILKKLGAGGMGAVYLAHDTKLDRQVALKVPHFGGDNAALLRDRFLREARAAAALNHPNLCRVYDVGVQNGVDYFTMPFLDGNPLSKLVGKDRPWNPRQAADLVRKVALALELLHRNGIVHRDLKPSNIIVRPTGEPVLMDFGLARSFALDSPHLTASGVPVGTPAYMSPEQVDGDASQLGPATDIYSLGVILFELVTGQLPFDGPHVAVFAQILNTPAPRPSTLRPGLGSEIDALCERAMAKRLGQRYSTMSDFAADLERVPQQTVVAPAAPTGAPGAVTTALRGHAGIKTAADHPAALPVSPPPMPTQSRGHGTPRPTLSRPAPPLPAAPTLHCSRCDQPIPAPLLPGSKILCVRCEALSFLLEQAAVPTVPPGPHATVIARNEFPIDVPQSSSPRRRTAWILLGLGVVLLAVVVIVVVSQLGDYESPRREPAITSKDTDETKDRGGTTDKPQPAPGTDITRKDAAPATDKPPLDTGTKDSAVPLPPTADKVGSDAKPADKPPSDQAPMDKATTDKPEPPMPSLLLDAPNELTAVVGQPRKVAIRVQRVNCTGLVDIRLAAPVAGVTVQPAMLAENANDIELTLMIAATASPGDRTVRFRAVCGAVQRDTSLALTIREARPVTIDEKLLKPSRQNTLDMKLMLIRRGKFSMGSPALEVERAEEEGPQQEVRILQPYYMAAHEVTVGQFKQFVEDSKTSPPATGNTYEYGECGTQSIAGGSWENVNWKQSDEHPVVNVSWQDAVDFCKWLSKKEGETYELPTEAEWEYACRAGSTESRYLGDDVQVTVMGNVADGTFKAKFLDRPATARNDDHLFTAPVGKFRANAWGLHDLYGNAAEWCADTYKTYPKDGEVALEMSNLRMVRGGSWYDAPAACRSASRGRYDPATRLCTVGFRVVMRPKGMQ